MSSPDRKHKAVDLPSCGIEIGADEILILLFLHFSVEFNETAVFAIERNDFVTAEIAVLHESNRA
jgi:hypothetical protein